MGAPGGPGGSGGAGVWLKGGPTPGAACWRGLMGETVGKSRGRGGAQVWTEAGPPPPTPQPRPRTHSVGPAQPSGSWQPPPRSGQPLELRSGSQGPGDRGARLVRTTYLRPGVPWGVTPPTPAQGTAAPAPMSRKLLTPTTPHGCDLPRVPHPVPTSQRRLPSPSRPQLPTIPLPRDQGPPMPQERVPFLRTSIPDTAGGQGAEAAGGLLTVWRLRVEPEEGGRAASPGGGLGPSRPQLRAKDR